MYKVYDMYGHLVRGGFKSWKEAAMWRDMMGRPDWTIDNK